MPFPDDDWRTIRAKQPAALHLKVTLPKDHFHQGERIDARLDFVNDDSQVPYSIQVGAGSPGAFFHATDDKGKDAIDPLRWIDDLRWMPCGGMVGHFDVDGYFLVLPVNENVRFERLGVYQLYAIARVHPGKDFASAGAEDVRLISDPVTVTITPLDPAEEARSIAEAVAGIHPGTPKNRVDRSSWDGIKQLQYLQTPAARAKLIKLLGESTLNNAAGDALFASPDPNGDAGRILAEVKAGKLVLGPFGVNLYAWLKRADVRPHLLGVDEQTRETRKRAAESQEQENQARQEIITAMVQSTKEGTPEHVAALWTAFEGILSSRGLPDEPDPDSGAARKAVGEHQLELPTADVKQMIESWSFYRGSGTKEFLPVVRREVTARTDTNALLALCTMIPEEARPLMIEELKRPDSLFFKGGFTAGKMSEVPPLPLPEMDDLFGAKLAKPDRSLEEVVSLITTFGSEKLLPDLLARKDKDVPGQEWGPDLKISLESYWVRVDPPAAVADFKKELLAGGVDFWITFRLRQISGWFDTALPFVRVAVQGDNPDIIYEAKDLLVKHGTDADLEAIISVLGRQAKDKDSGPWAAKDAKALLGNSRWHPTPEQKKALVALAGS